MRGDRVVVGRVAGVYGVRGWVRVQSYTQPIENLLDYGPWLLTLRGEVTLAEGRAHGKGLIARLDGIDDRDAAGALVGQDISVARDALPATDEGEYYWNDLIGLRVINRDGASLGEVVRLIETGAHDVLVTQGERERLIPYALGAVVDEVDLPNGLIRVDWGADF
ncbi:MAG: ribosome maturation factor RimM [Pseudomonadota bacterium]